MKQRKSVELKGNVSAALNILYIVNVRTITSSCLLSSTDIEKITTKDDIVRVLNWGCNIPRSNIRTAHKLWHWTLRQKVRRRF